MNQRKLKSVFIYPVFQVKFLLISLCLITILSSIYFFAARLAFNRFEAMGSSAGLPISNVYFQFIEEQRNSLYLTMGLSYLTLVVVAGFVSYWFSHRVAGPMRRLETSLASMAKSGELKEIEFRENDFFRDIPERFNAMVRSQSSKRKN